MTDKIIELNKFFSGKGEMKGFFFRRMKIGIRTYMYKFWNNNGAVYFDVFARRFEEFENYKSVIYPNVSSFGDWAWVFEDYKEAVDKYNKLENNEN